jgi:quercetin dioxygenase-like cupin family protein
MDNFTEQIHNLINFADYQDNSVVSKTIIKGNAGTFTYFAFDKGQSLSEHTTPFDAIVQIIDGKAEINISGNPYHLSAGEMLIMPANKPHSLIATEKFKMLLTMFKSV